MHIQGLHSYFAIETEYLYTYVLMCKLPRLRLWQVALAGRLGDFKCTDGSNDRNIYTLDSGYINIYSPIKQPVTLPKPANPTRMAGDTEIHPKTPLYKAVQGWGGKGASR